MLFCFVLSNSHFYIANRIFCQGRTHLYCVTAFSATTQRIKKTASKSSFFMINDSYNETILSTQSVTRQPTPFASSAPLVSGIPSSSPTYYSSYLLNQVKPPDFSKALSWDKRSESYAEKVNQLLSAKNKNMKSMHLMRLLYGVTYTEWFEMKSAHHLMILHRESTSSFRTSSLALNIRCSRV